MSDTSLPVIFRFDTTANRMAFTPAPGVSEQLYIWADSDDQPNAYYWDGAAWQLFNAGGGGGGTTSIGVCNGRLTTESGVPVSITDRTAQSTIYWTPYLGNQIGLYDGANWQLVTFSELSLALSGLTSGKNYDVFIDYNGGTPQIVLSAAWTNDTTRADALALQDGIYVKSGATDHRWVGTIRTTSTTTTEDSGGITGTTQVGGKRFVWNYYNQVLRPNSVVDLTNSWTYTSATVRQANGAAGNKIEYVTGINSGFISASLVHNWLASNAGAGYHVGIGIDSTTTFSGLRGWGYICCSGLTTIGNIVGFAQITSALGYHYLSWNESGATGVTSYGDNNSADQLVQSGMKAFDMR